MGVAPRAEALKVAVLVAPFVRLTGETTNSGGPPNVSKCQLPTRTNPRARITPRSNNGPRGNCQPLAIRTPSPSSVQSTPFAECAKLARHTSGPGPLRSQL